MQSIQHPMQMRIDELRNLIGFRLIAAITFVALATGCATGPRVVDAPDVAAARSLREARSVSFSEEERVGHYLDAAALTAP